MDRVLGFGLVVLVMFMVAIASTLVGGVVGWVVGEAFHDTFLRLRDHFGLSDLTMWEIGCGLGFVGAFFRGTGKS